MVGGESHEFEAEARANAAVLADRLMQVGDPRGELLALELTAANTRDPIRARRIHRAVQVLRDRHPDLAWPDPAGLDEFPLKVRAGFVLGARLHEVAAPNRLLEADVDERSLVEESANAGALANLLEHPAAEGLQRLQLGALDPDQLDASLRLLASRPGKLDLLGLRLTGPQQLDESAAMLSTIAARGLRIEYDRVTGLLLGAAQERISLAKLSASPSLRVLSLAGYVDPGPLGDLPIDTLDCWCRSSEDLEQIAALPRLRRLCLRHDDALVPLVEARGLEALALQVGDPNELEILSKFDSLRILALHLPNGQTPSFPTGLERLELRDTLPARLDELRGLSNLELLGLRGNMVEPGPLDLGPLAELPRLRSLTLDLFSHTPRGCDRLVQLRSLTVIGRVDLRWFAGTALDELTITGGIPPRMLSRLSELGPLRRLRLPARVLQGIDGVTLGRLLPELEELELFGATIFGRGPAPASAAGAFMLAADQFAGFPRLRRLVVDDLDRGRARFFSEELPEIALETVAPPSDPLGLASAFDWRGANWPRDIH